MKVTVLLPVYNSADYLSTAIESVLKQTYSTFELLIIDDGSTDNSIQVAKQFTDNRIRLVSKKHSGLSSTLNYGLRIAKYDWVARMDADEIWHPEKLEKQLKHAQYEVNDIYFTGCSYFSNKKIMFLEIAPSTKEKFLKKLALHCTIPHPSVIYNRKFILENGGYDKNIPVFEDYELWLRLKTTANFILLNEYFVYKRFRRESLSSMNRYINRSIIYEYQQPYYNDLSYNFGINSREEQLSIRGWREFFYGRKEKSREFWKQIKFYKLHQREKLAYLLSYFPSFIVAKFIGNVVRLKICYFLNSIPSNIYQKEFILILNKLQKNQK